MLRVAVLRGGVDELAPTESLAFHAHLRTLRDLGEKSTRAVGRLRANARQLLTALACLLFEEGDDEVVLRREVTEEGRARHARFGDETVDTHAADAGRHEQASRRVEDAVSGRRPRYRRKVRRGAPVVGHDFVHFPLALLWVLRHTLTRSR